MQADLQKKESKGVFFATLSTALFALQFPILKLSFNYLVPAVGALLESLFTLLFSFVNRKKTEKIREHFLKPVLLISGMLNALGLICLFISIQELDPTTASFMGRLYFAFSAFLSVVMLGESLRKHELKWILVLLLGAFLTAYREDLGSHFTLLGIFCALSYPLLFALQNAFVKRAVTSEIDPNSILLITKLWSLLPLAAYVFFTGAELPDLNAVPGVLYVAVATFFSTFLGLRIFYAAFALTSYRKANLIKAIEPVFVYVFSVPFFPTDFTTANFVGMAVIVFSALGLAKLGTTESVPE